MNAIYAAPELRSTRTRQDAREPCSAVAHFEAEAYGAGVTEYELLERCRERLTGYERPKRLVIGELPKTSTGKIRKNELRDLARSTT